MIKNIFRLSNISNISKRCFTTSSSTSNFNGLGFPIISTNKIFKFNLDGTLKTKENDQSTLSLKELNPIFNNLSLNETPYNPIIIEESNQKESIQHEMSSILIKRRKKMSKHKHRKLRKRTRALKKRLGKI